MRSRAVLLGVVVALALGVVPSGADERRVQDADDSDSVVVDVREATHGHHESLSRVLVHTFTFGEEPQPGDLQGILIEMKIPNDKRGIDRRLSVHFNPDNSLQVRIENRAGWMRAYGNAFWMNGDTLRVEFTKRALMKKASSYRWRAFVFSDCTPPPPTVCGISGDAVPDENSPMILHRL